MQFDVYKNENPTSRETFPFVLGVQADLLADLDSRVAVPLAPKATYTNKVLKARGWSFSVIRVCHQPSSLVSPPRCARPRAHLSTISRTCLLPSS